MLEEYKQIKTYMGVIQITNKANGKIYVDSYPNLKNKWLSSCSKSHDQMGERITGRDEVRSSIPRTDQ
jgi:hypothetical protein